MTSSQGPSVSHTPEGRGRDEIGTEAARHRITIGIDQRQVFCACGWRDQSEDNLSRPLARWTLHLTEALRPVVDAIAAEAAIQALADVAQRFRDLGQFGAFCVVQARIDARASAVAADGTEGGTE